MSDSPGNATIDFRHALATFATGVTVVTTMDEHNQPRGFTANSFTSVSLNPPLILVCLSRDAASCPVFSQSRRFCVNVLSENQQDVCALFASPERCRFEQIGWRQGRHGCPVIDDVISWFQCETHKVVDAGDHVILLGRVLDHDFNSRSPLVYCGGSYVEFGLLQRAMEGADRGASTLISAVVNCDGSIPMVRNRATGKMSLPTAENVGSAEDSNSLIGKLATNGIQSPLPFVCAVYEDARLKIHNVVYRGTSERVDDAAVRDFEMVPLNEIPWDHLVDSALEMLLERYIEESERDAFGVYVGDAERGEVHAIH